MLGARPDSRPPRHVPAVWNALTTTNADRKELLRCLLERVLVPAHDNSDTADCYTAWSSRMGGRLNPGGISEEIIGRWMAKRGNRATSWWPPRSERRGGCNS